MAQYSTTNPNVGNEMMLLFFSLLSLRTRIKKKEQHEMKREIQNFEGEQKLSTCCVALFKLIISVDKIVYLRQCVSFSLRRYIVST